MLSKLLVALLVMASPAAAQDAPPTDQPESEAVTAPTAAPFKLKKVCRSQDVVGSSIPRTVCTTKRIYLEPGEEASADNKSSAEPQSQN